MRARIHMLKHWFNEHTLAVLVGCAIALTVVSPHLRAWLIIGPDNFEGVYPAFNDDEITYQARIKEVLEGNFNIGNPYIREHKDDTFIMPPIAESLIALIAFVTDTSVPFVTSVSDFVLSFIGFLLLYTLFLTLTQRNKLVALLYTTLFFIFSLSTIGRPISPQLNALFLFGGIIAITRVYFYEGRETKKHNCIAGFIAGITCFISPYYFTALLALYGTLVGFRIVFERSFDILKKQVPWFLVTFIPLASLYAFFQLRAASDSFYSETMLRYGLMHTHIPGSFTNMVFGMLTFVVLVSAWKFLIRRDFVYALGAVISIFMLNWQNIITGTSLQFSSHYLFTTILLVLMVCAIIHTALLKVQSVGIQKLMKLGIVAGLVGVLLIIALNQKNEFIRVAEMPYSSGELRTMQKKMQVFSWFNSNTPEDSVVYALGDTYDFLLPIYTKNRVYYNFYAALYPSSDRENEERWITQQLFDENISTTTVRERQREFWGNKYIDTFQSGENRKKIIAKLTGGTYVPGEMIDEKSIEALYERWVDIKTEPVEKALTQYQINYILLSEQYPYFESAKERLEAMDSVTWLATIGTEHVYAFRNPF